MSQRRKTYPGFLYFVTLTVKGWIDLFTRNFLADIIIDNLKYCQKHKCLNIYSYVLMPSHLHMIADTDNDRELNSILAHFKSYTAKEIIKTIDLSIDESRKEWLLYLFKFLANIGGSNSTYSIWQSGNYPVLLDTNEIIDQKADYIHNNPVEAGIVTEPHHYYYSSAHPMSPIKTKEL